MFIILFTDISLFGQCKVDALDECDGKPCVAANTCNVIQDTCTCHKVSVKNVITILVV